MDIPKGSGFQPEPTSGIPAVFDRLRGAGCYDGFWWR